MYPDLIALSIPFLVGSVVFEYMLDTTKKQRHYRLKDTISNMGCGIVEQITNFISKGLLLAVYAYLYGYYRIDTIPLTSIMGWLALIVLVDLIFYVFHKACHQHNILWSAHVVHHEVQEYNLTVALRRSVLQEFVIIPVYLPLAIAGFHPAAFLLIFAVHNLYQFWIHAAYAPKLKLFGLVFNTPEHHIVHHCRNEPYRDKNFAGIFILWDKWFGTFEPFDTQPEVGITQVTTTYNPIKAQYTTLLKVFQGARQMPTFLGKFRFLWASPKTIADLPAGTGARSAAALPTANIWWSSFLFTFAVVVVAVYRYYEFLLTQDQHYVVLASLGILLNLIGRSIDGKEIRK